MLHLNVFNDAEVVLVVGFGGGCLCLRTQVAARSVSVLSEDFL